jgi:uncharacterized protein YciI
LTHFVLRCVDAPEVKAQRAALREAHVAHVRGAGVTKLAGPLLDERGEIVGSMLVIEAEDLAAAQAFAAEDPYNQGGVFQSVEIQPYRPTFIAF